MSMAVGFGYLVAVAVTAGVTGAIEQQLAIDDHMADFDKDPLEGRTLEKFACEAYNGTCQRKTDFCDGELKKGRKWCRKPRKNGCCIPPKEYEICPSPFVLRGNECFFIHEDRSETLNWVDSRTRCLSLGGDLAQPDDLGDFTRFISEYPIGTVPLWLAATFIEKEKQWKWLSGESVPDATFPINRWPVPNVGGDCMILNYKYDPKWYYFGLQCMQKATFACEFVPGEISSISIKSFTHSSLEVDWIPPPDNKHYYTYSSYNLKWTDSRSNNSLETNVTAPPYTITGLAPCANYIITVTPYPSYTGEGEPSNSVSMATGVDVAITGYTVISVKNWSPILLAYYNRMGPLDTCKLECSRQVACTAFTFKAYRGYGCVFYSCPIPLYEEVAATTLEVLYMKQGCNSF